MRITKRWCERQKRGQARSRRASLPEERRQYLVKILRKQGANAITQRRIIGRRRRVWKRSVVEFGKWILLCRLECPRQRRSQIYRRVPLDLKCLPVKYYHAQIGEQKASTIETGAVFQRADAVESLVCSGQRSGERDDDDVALEACIRRHL